ncbi:hypothetical protein Tco_0142853 [Tanacetum coccineum]
MPQRMAILEENVYEIRRVLAEQNEVIGAMARDFSRFIDKTEDWFSYFCMYIMMLRFDLFAYDKIKPGSKFSTIVHEYVTEPRMLSTPKSRMEKESNFKCVEAEEKFKLKTSL